MNYISISYFQKPCFTKTLTISFCHKLLRNNKFQYQGPYYYIFVNPFNFGSYKLSKPHSSSISFRKCIEVYE